MNKPDPRLSTLIDNLERMEARREARQSPSRALLLGAVVSGICVGIAVASIAIVGWQGMQERRMADAMDNLAWLMADQMDQMSRMQGDLQLQLKNLPTPATLQKAEPKPEPSFAEKVLLKAMEADENGRIGGNVQTDNRFETTIYGLSTAQRQRLERVRRIYEKYDLPMPPQLDALDKSPQIDR